MLRVEQGKTTIETALGMSATLTITRAQLGEKMVDILQTIYGEQLSLDKIINYLCGDIHEKYFKGLKSFSPYGQKEFSSQTLNALIYSLDLFIAHESSQTKKTCYITFKNELIAYVQANNIEIEAVNPYHKDWNKLFPEHCYNLILETLGIDVWSR